MTKSVLMTFAACAFALAPSLSHAAGSSPVAWVSKQFGANKSGCGPVTDPCQTFQYAHDNIVAPGGTINVRDAGGYGPLVIRNSISIINESGLVAGIFGAQGNAIDIQAGASDAILIKGLTLNGANASANGINVASGGSITVANCTVTNFVNSGIRSDDASATINFSLYSVIISNITSYGIFANANRFPVLFNIDDIKINNSFYGVYMQGDNFNMQATINFGSISSNNTGIYVSGISSLVIVNNVDVHYNTVVGVKVLFNGTVAVSRSRLTMNTADVNIFSTGHFKTAGDNFIGSVSGGTPSPAQYQ